MPFATITLRATNSAVFALERRKSPGLTSHAGRPSSEGGRRLFSSGRNSPQVTALTFNTPHSPGRRGSASHLGLQPDSEPSNRSSNRAQRQVDGSSKGGLVGAAFSERLARRRLARRSNNCAASTAEFISVDNAPRIASSTSIERKSRTSRGSLNRRPKLACRRCQLSCSSCGLSAPARACRVDWRRAFCSFRRSCCCFSNRSHRAISSLTLATMRDCSANGGMGISNCSRTFLLRPSRAMPTWRLQIIVCSNGDLRHKCRYFRTEASASRIMVTC